MPFFWPLLPLTSRLCVRFIITTVFYRFMYSWDLVLSVSGFGQWVRPWVSSSVIVVYPCDWMWSLPRLGPSSWQSHSTRHPSSQSPYSTSLTKSVSGCHPPISIYLDLLWMASTSLSMRQLTCGRWRDSSLEIRLVRASSTALSAVSCTLQLSLQLSWTIELIASRLGEHLS